MIAIAAFVAQELVEQTEIFEHLFLRFEKEVILELDDIERWGGGREGMGRSGIGGWGSSLSSGGAWLRGDA